MAARFVSLVLSIVLSFLLVTSGATFAARNSRAIVVGINNDAVGWDPLMHSDAFTISMQVAILETLTRYGPGSSGKETPWLLSSVSPVNSTTWRLKVRDGVRFSDGERFDAAALKWNLETYGDKTANYPNSASRILRQYVKEVRLVDDQTVDLVATQPTSLVPEALERVFVLPPTYYQKVGTQGFRRRPVGTGAWRLKEWARGDRIVMSANTQYWDAGAKPNFDALVFRPIPEATSRAAALLADEIDLATNIAPEAIDSVQHHANLRVEKSPGLMIYIGLDGRARPFNDVRLRQAVNYAVNWDEVIAKIFSGHAQRNIGGFFPYQQGFDPALRSFYTYNPVKARQLLSEAGLSTGLVVPYFYGRELEGAVKNDEVAQSVAGYLSAVGVKVELHQVDPATFFPDYRSRKFAGGLYQLDWGAFAPSGRDLFTLLDSKSRDFYWKSEGTDKLIEDYLSAVTATDRVRSGRTLHRHLVEQAPWLFAYQQDDLYGVTNRLVWKPWLSPPLHPATMTIR